MQTLYSMEREGVQADARQAGKSLAAKFEQSRSLFTYLMLVVTEIAGFANKDSAKRSSRFLPSEDDLSVNTKISSNLLLLQIRADSGFNKAVHDFGLEHKLDDGLIKKTFKSLAASPEYADYIESEDRNMKSEKKILEFIFANLMLPNEDVISHLEEHFINWDDDAEMMEVLVTSYLSKPVAGAFASIISDEKLSFAKDLLSTVMDKKDITMELIKPKLKNWEADRIASLDLIILQMGICEFLYFETIPVKVSINEYIDLAKEYSTPQSGQFVNGLLDNINKELATENKIRKKIYKNSTL